MHFLIKLELEPEPEYYFQKQIEKNKKVREAFKKKTTKHMEFSLCWFNPPIPTPQHMEKSFAIFFIV